MFLYERFLRPIFVEDVTEDEPKFQVALRMVAESYVRLSSHELRAEDVCEELCLDEYRERGFSRTFVAIGYNPNANCVEVLGTASLVIGRRQGEDSDLEPLEFMSLVEPAEGWDNFDFEDFRPECAAEVSRFVIPSSCTKGKARAAGLPLHLMRRLIDTVFVALQQHGLKQLWALAPRYVVRVAEAAGFTMLPAPGIRLNYEKNRELFEKYDRYWKHCCPRLHRMYNVPGALVANPVAS